MGKYIMAVQSKPVEGRDDEYNAWYDHTHFKDILALPGVTGGRRFNATPIAMGAPGLPYLAIFEVETDDPGALLQEMGRRASNGEWQNSEALDAPASILWFYEQRSAGA